MTRGQIEERLVALHAQERKLFADYHIIRGAIADCEYWLAKLDAPKFNDDSSTSSDLGPVS